MNSNDDNKLRENDNTKSKKQLVWDMFFSGGWSSFNKEWKNSNSSLQTTLMFLVPILMVGIIILLAILASKIFR